MVEIDTDPSDGMNRFMDEHLTMWGFGISAQVRQYDTLDPEALANDRFKVSDLKETVLALHVKEDTPRSPENGRPYMLHARDMEALRDLLIFATERGMLNRQLRIADDPT